MTRKSDDGLRPSLLERIVDNILDRSLELMTFRGLASDLQISTYNLVYHFGLREQLIAEIVRNVAQRELDSRPALTGETLELFGESLRRYATHTVNPETLKLRRIWIEGCLRDPKLSRDVDLRDVAIADLRDALRMLGLTDGQARVEATLVTDALWGIQLSAIVRPDKKAAASSIDTLINDHRDRVTSITTSNSPLAFS